jgi:hypothetical protein
MSFSPLPRFVFRDVTDVSPGFLSGLGIKFLIVDLDNTIAAYDEHVPSSNVAQWISEMKSGGIGLFIISNSLRRGRVEAFAEALGVDFIMGARKPSSKAVLRAMDLSGFSAGNTALVGDQVYTDSLAANRAGVVSIIVRPRRFTNPFLALRFAFEAPFRAVCKNKMWKEV